MVHDGGDALFKVIPDPTPGGAWRPSNTLVTIFFGLMVRQPRT
jgi:hypothetical protein